MLLQGTIENTRATEVNLPRHAHQRNMGLLELEVQYLDFECLKGYLCMII